MPRSSPAAERRAPDDAAPALRDAGLRVTGPRLGVLAALRAHPHADADTVITAVRRRQGSVSVQAVYNVLAALVDAGLVRRIEPAGSPARFEVRVGDNHHHIVCRRCGATADVDCAVGRRPCLTPTETHGYALDEAEVTFWGLCPRCQPRRAPRANTARRKERRT
ncbi:MAG TPA: Fur family transcriptional regulator [Acidimicrobiales bacterium]|nr:Fur family transcriptional regulator [Acidimicrobiales bacterium]HUI02591.1 Fur family transcriptional regulator [Acidimicrobiales bacterium]